MTKSAAARCCAIRLNEYDVGRRLGEFRESINGRLALSVRQGHDTLVLGEREGLRTYSTSGRLAFSSSKTGTNSPGVLTPTILRFSPSVAPASLQLGKNQSHLGFVERVVQNRHLIGCREGVLDELQQLRLKLIRLVAESGCVGAWLLQALDDAQAYWIGDRGKHDRYRPCCLRQRERGLRAGRKQDVWLEGDEFGGELRQSVKLAVGEPTLDREVVPRTVAKLLESAQGRLRIWTPRWWWRPH